MRLNDNFIDSLTDKIINEVEANINMDKIVEEASNQLESIVDNARIRIEL